MFYFNIDLNDYKNFNIIKYKKNINLIIIDFNLKYNFIITNFINFYI